jgi:hypothetical protein
MARLLRLGGILDQMLAVGWSFEGNGTTRAFACVPAET